MLWFAFEPSTNAIKSLHFMNIWMHNADDIVKSRQIYYRSRLINYSKFHQVLPEHFYGKIFLTFYETFTTINKVIDITKCDIVKHRDHQMFWLIYDRQLNRQWYKHVFVLRQISPGEQSETCHRNSFLSLPSITERHWRTSEHFTTQWFILRFVIMRNLDNLEQSV